MKKECLGERHQIPPLDLIDGFNQSCLKIITLAELLEYFDGGYLRPETISHAGTMIAREAAELREKLDAFCAQQPR